MASLQPERRDFRKPLLAAAAVAVALAVGIPAMHVVTKHAKRPRLAPYGLQLVDDGGRALGEAHGPLKIVFDPFTVYRVAPNQRTPRVTINELGSRGEAQETRGETVVFLGGSACFGQELAGDNEVFTGVLGRANANKRWLNFGCPGYHSGQELAFYTHRLRRVAAAVVASVGGWNDVFGAVQGAPRRGGLEDVSSVFFEVRDRLCEFHVGGRERSVAPPEVSRDEAFERACQAYLDNMIDLHRLSAARGAAFLWVVQPELGSREHRPAIEDKMLAAWEQNYRYSSAEFRRRYAELRRRADAAAREHGVPFVDVNDAEDWRSASQVLFADPVHPNAAGHQLLAQILCRAVERLERRGGSETAN